MKFKRILTGVILIFLLSMSSFACAYGYDSVIVDERDRAIEDAVDYLHDMQNDDGGFAAKEGRDSSISVTCWTISALAAAGEDLESQYWNPSGYGPVEYVLNAENEIEDTLEYVRILLALSAADINSEYKGENLEDIILSFQQSDGHFGQTEKGEDLMINTHMWSVIALESVANRDYDREKAKDWLIKSQNDDGGFGWLIGGESDSDDTGVAIQALVLLGEDSESSPSIEKALDFIKSRQGSDGGFSASDMMGNDSNSASDAWSMQGLIAAGQDYDGSYWSQENENVKTHLMSLQNKDGSFDWKDGVSSSPVKMTAYALTAFCEKPYPVNVDYSELNSGFTFTDLSSRHWAYDSISYLVGEKVINGYPDSTFNRAG